MAMRQMEPTEVNVGEKFFILRRFLHLKRRILLGSWHQCWLLF